MANINTGIETNSIDNKSFALLRTNPKLTSNVKLVIDSSSNLFLSSFRANKELSKVEYQKYRVDPNSEYSVDISKYYKGLPNSVRYDVLRKYSDLTLYSDYEFQYEDQYQAGASFNSTKIYDEQYKIFAPIWLDKKIPGKFVIYRVSSATYDTKYLENTVGQNKRIIDLLKNATIVKTFDLSINSNIGKYLTNHVNSKLFPKSALTISFGDGDKSSFNGIDILNGGFARKQEILEDYYINTDYPEIFNNETITGGFERNSVIPANIVNLEFLFDDDNAEDYKIFKYFGLYVDDYDEGSFKPNYINKRGEIHIDPESYNSFYDLSNTSLSDIDMFPSKNDLIVPSLNYVKDKEGNYYHVFNKTVDENVEYNKIKISLDKSTSGFFEGYARVGNTINAVSTSDEFKGFIKLTIVDNPTNNDKLFFGDKLELEIYDYNLGIFMIIADSSLDEGTYSGNRFSSNGSTSKVANALNNVITHMISEMTTGRYTNKIEGSSIIIEDYAYGNKKRQTAFGIYTKNISNFIRIDSGENNNIGLIDSIVPPVTSTFFSKWNIYTSVGGSDINQAIIVKKEDIGKLKVGEYVSRLNSKNFIKIVEIEADPYNIDQYRVILEKATIMSKDNIFEVYANYDVVHGKFSAYDFKDFDFDFYSIKNSQLGDLLYENDFAEDIENVYTPSSFFSKLNPVLQQDDVDNLTTVKDILSEYDRLEENKLKETSLKSRVVPVINKFSLVDGTNARSLDYILNANEAFGPDNMSPNINIASTRNPEYFNMEHFHINKIPSDYYEDDKVLKLRGLSNFLDFNNAGGITLDELKSTSFNYFDVYFKWNGCYYEDLDIWVNNEFKKLYTKFNDCGTDSNSSTVFRGLKYTYKKRKETKSMSPTDFIMSSEVSDYKFGVVLNYSNNANSIENLAPITVVKNESFKFICVYIELSIINNSVSDINRMLSYNLKDLYDINGSILNIDLPFQIDFRDSIIGGEDDIWILTASTFAIEDGSADFINYIIKDKNGTYSSISFEYAGGTYACEVYNVIDSANVEIKGWPRELDINGNILDIKLNPIHFSLISILPNDSKFKYHRGGSNKFTELLESINAYQFAERFNKFNNVNYISIYSNGAVKNNDFVLTIEDGTSFHKPSLVETSADPDKPKAYQLSSGEVGSIIVDRADGGYVTILRRMNGDYNPIVNDVISFTDMYTNNKVLVENPNERELLIYNKFNNLGIAFSSYKNTRRDYGYINNYFYHKVNDENSKNILKLSQTSDKLPVYPNIGEIAIDKKNINLFKSKYAEDYFTKSLPAGKSVEVYGTLSPVEKINFMSSTIMKVKNTYDLTSFTSNQENSLNDLDIIRANAQDTYAIHWFEDVNDITLDFYLPRAIVEELLDDGIKAHFSNYVNAANSYGDKDSIDDDLTLYINSNIVNRFIIDLIKVYGIESKNIDTEIVSVHDVIELTYNSFKPLTNYAIKSYQNDALSFRLIYNKRSGYSYKFKMHIKIQA